MRSTWMNWIVVAMLEKPIVKNGHIITKGVKMGNCDVVKMSKCFWCGGQKDELIMLGDRARVRDRQSWCDNKEMSVIANYEPCKECEKKFAQGVHVIEIAQEPLAKDQPALQNGIYPTGSMWVIDADAAKEIFKTDEPKIAIDKKTAVALGLYEAGEKE